ncbi:hypothetical protein ACFPRL_30160 [Pseudoclavibacter helvolus]
MPPSSPARHTCAAAGFSCCPVTSRDRQFCDSTVRSATSCSISGGTSGRCGRSMSKYSAVATCGCSLSVT